MSIIDKLKKFRESFFKENIYEEGIDENRVYRLHYLYFNDKGVKEMHDVCCDAFVIPMGWDKEDAFKLISYFFDHSDYETGSYHCCSQTTSRLNEFGFKSAKELINICEPVDLLSVICNNCGYMFRESEYYKLFFGWYHENITIEEVTNICNKYNFEIPDIESKKKSFTK